jgi:hypothetical protein
MAAFAPVVIQDAIDVEHTFAPRNLEGGVASFVESTGVPISDKKVTLNMGKPTATGRRRISFKIALPVTQDVVVGGISKPTVVRSIFVDMNFQFESTSTMAERADAHAFAYKLLANNVALRAIDYVEGPW